MRIGYRRVSSIGQNLDRQLADQLDVEKVFEEKVSGSSRDRPALNEMIEFAREGDEIIVHALDRLGRDIRDLLNIVEQLNTKGVTVEFLSEQLRFSRESNDPLAKLQLHMLASFAEWERATAKRRQAEGIARAKLHNPEKYRGRPIKIDVNEIKRLKQQGLGATAIAKQMNIGRASVYRALKVAEF